MISTYRNRDGTEGPWERRTISGAVYDGDDESVGLGTSDIRWEPLEFANAVEDWGVCKAEIQYGSHTIFHPVKVYQLTGDDAVDIAAVLAGVWAQVVGVAARNERDAHVVIGVAVTAQGPGDFRADVGRQRDIRGVKGVEVVRGNPVCTGEELR